MTEHSSRSRAHLLAHGSATSLLALLVLLVGPPDAAGQDHPAAGDLIRVTGETGPVRATGRFLEVRDEALIVHLLEAPDPLELPLARLRRLELQAPRRPWDGAGRRGIASAAVAGGTAFAVHWLLAEVVFADFCPNAGLGECIRDPEGEALQRRRLALGVSVVGLAVGGLRGWSSPGSRWVDVPVASIVPQ